MKRSVIPRNSVVSDLEIKTKVTQLLEMTDSSFAALYGFVARELGAAFGVERLAATLKRLGDGGRVAFWIDSDRSRAPVAPDDWTQLVARYAEWLGDLSVDALSTDSVSYDPIELWCGAVENTPGRRQGVSADLDVEGALLVIRAETLQSAEEARTSWVEARFGVRADSATRSVRESEGRVTVTWSLKSP